MATQDWPTDRDFLPSGFRKGADVPTSGWRGFYTGTRETTSHAADRLTVLLTLPPCKRTPAARREAFLGALLSTGDTVRFPMFHRREPAGTTRGSGKVYAVASAGARSVTVDNLAGTINLLAAPQAFDVAPWTGSATVTANTTATPFSASLLADTLADSSAAAIQDRSQVITIAADSSSYACSIYVRKTSGGTSTTFRWSVTLGGGSGTTGTCRLNTDDGTNQGSGQTVTSVDANWWRVTVVVANDGTNTTLTVAAAPASNTFGNIATNSVTATGSAIVWGAQVEVGTSAGSIQTGRTLLGGDFMSIGGNLLEVAYDGASEFTSGRYSVPLVYPLQKALAIGDVVTFTAPTGTWALDATGIDLDYSAGVIQDGIALPFRQVIV